MQPTLRHVPPNVSFFSTQTVFSPNCAALIAATYPPGPDPITTRSASCVVEYNRCCIVRWAHCAIILLFG